jgi:16S rRNA (guanine966-N2)-methyltransferase
MRVIAGKLGGLSFSSASNATHPMSEKMRGALFNSLGDLGGLTLLDPFAGSGAISIEAISRGADSAVAIDSNKDAQADIEDNISKLKLKNRIQLIKTTANKWLNLNYDKRFDLIVCDPPYDRVQYDLIEQFEKLVKKDGLLVLSFPPKAELPRFKSLKLIDNKEYGDSRLVFYRNSQ